MHLISFVFLFLLASVQSFSQNMSKKADSLYDAKDYLPAAELYVKSASLQEFRNGMASAYYNAACCYALKGDKANAFAYLEMAIENGYENKDHLLKDSDLDGLHAEDKWKQITENLRPAAKWTDDPYKAQLITTDIDHFWEAYDLAQKDTANRLKIYRQYYIDKGTPGMLDYFVSKVYNMQSFLNGHNRRAKFYEAIRKNTLSIEKQKPGMIDGFVKFKTLYPEARFPNIYFVIGNFTSGGTSSDNGLLLGADQLVKTADIPTDELNLWEKNVFAPLENIPHIVAHELIHFNQDNLAQDTSLLSASLREGMADFLGELMTGKTSNERLHVWAKGREKMIWEDFKKEMWLNRAGNWIANARQETPDHPADLGYWVGYMICKAYYNGAADKKQAVYDILHIRDYKTFYEKSRVEDMLGAKG